MTKKKRITQPGHLIPKVRMPSGKGIYRKANSNSKSDEEETPALGADVCNLGMEQILLLMEKGSIKNILFVAVTDRGEIIKGLKVDKAYGPEFVQMVQVSEQLQCELLATPVGGLNESSYVEDIPCQKEKK